LIFEDGSAKLYTSWFIGTTGVLAALRGCHKKEAIPSRTQECISSMCSPRVFAFKTSVKNAMQGVF